MANAKAEKKFNIVLIGYRAVGKSTVGAQVAHRLGRPMIDLDAIVEQEAGESIPDLVSREGWAEFRRREKPWCSVTPPRREWYWPPGVG